MKTKLQDMHDGREAHIDQRNLKSRWFGKGSQRKIKMYGGRQAHTFIRDSFLFQDIGAQLSSIFKSPVEASPSHDLCTPTVHVPTARRIGARDGDIQHELLDLFGR